MDCTCTCHEDAVFLEAQRRRALIQNEKNLARLLLFSSPANRPLAGEDFEHAMSLLKRHPKCEEKIGSGVKAIVPTISDTWKGQRYFKIVRTDDTEDYFSYKKCIQGETSNPRKDFYTACRKAVEPIMRDFKYSRLKKRASGYTVDHTAPWYFSTIVAEFGKERNIDFDAMEYFESKFVDRKMENEFIEYHNKRAWYALITVKEQIEQNKFFFKDIENNPQY